jgi:hypothetical protein
LAGKHEPPTRTSFYLSLSASTLKVGIVIAALVGGVFVIAKAFPGNTSESVLSPPPKTSAPHTTPSSTPPTPRTSKPPARHANKNIVVLVLNGSGGTGLAGLFSNTLKNADYQLKTPDNSPRRTTTVIYYRSDSKANYVADAEALKAKYFNDLKGVVVRKAPSSVAPDVNIEVILGTDFAALTAASPSPPG